ncbi:hypothetical protein [Kribbella ginsengisoli]|uniref:Uncharacterized protein n=1 Tax=Kribbella ginsengisoli TaxID=363865 RepID=A0ABP6XA80_9ACTN
MTDWSKLHHAYGPAVDIPALLDQVATHQRQEDWDELWSRLCHQSTVYPASFAALPWLASMAGDADPEQAVNAVMLGASIVEGAGQAHGAGDVLTRYAGEIALLLAKAPELGRTVGDRLDYLYLLGAMLALEGMAGWSDELAWGFSNGQFELACPGCEVEVAIVVDGRGFFTALVDDEEGERGSLEVDGRGRLDELGVRLRELAIGDGQVEVAEMLRYVFGTGSCPACGARFNVAEELDA